MSIGICHRCQFRAPPDRGASVCTADASRHDIIDKAKSDACPKGYFGKPDNPVVLRQTLKNMMRPPEPIPDDFHALGEVRRLKSGGCCGAPSTRPE